MKQVSKRINLSVSTVNLEERVLGAASLISVGPARGHEHKGMHVFADLTTLKMVAELINKSEEQPYVNINHDDSLGSKIGRILNAKVIGNAVVSSLKFLDVAFSDVCKNIGSYIFKVASEDESLIGLSLELMANFEVIEDKAYIRPTKVDGVSVVSDPAFKTSLAMYNSLINKDKENTMPEEEKKQEVPAQEAVKAAEPVAEPKPEEPKAEPVAEPKPEEPKAEPVAEEPKAEEPAKEPTLAEVSAKIDSLMEAISQIASLVPAFEALKEKTVEAQKEVSVAKEEVAKVLSAKEDAEKQLKLAAERADIVIAQEEEKFDVERCKTDMAYYRSHKKEYISHFNKR